MAIKRVPKKRIVTSLNNLPAEIQNGIAEKYPLGFTDAMMRIDKPNGDFFYAVPFETEEVDYLVKINVKVDNASANDDKDIFDGDEIKGADDLPTDEEEDDETPRTRRRSTTSEFDDVDDDDM